MEIFKLSVVFFSQKGRKEYLGYLQCNYYNFFSESSYGIYRYFLKNYNPTTATVPGEPLEHL